MRLWTFVCAALLACGSLTGEAAAMRLVEFEFEGTSSFAEAWTGSFNQSANTPSPISGRITLDLDAPGITADKTYYPAEAIRAFTVELNFLGNLLTGEHSLELSYTSDVPLPDLNQGVQIKSGTNPNWPVGPDTLELAAHMVGPTTTIASAPDDLLHGGVGPGYRVQLQRIELSSTGPAGMADSEQLTVANILAFANQGLTFTLRGDTYSPSHIFGSPPGEDPDFFGSSSTSDLDASSSTSDLYIREEFANATLLLSQHGFEASGTITSLAEVVPTPLPAAAWLMLSGLAALVGVRVWPRRR